MRERVAATLHLRCVLLILINERPGTMSDLRSTGGSTPRGGEWPVGCPACKSASPERHPAMQSGGEIELCTHDYHLQPTAQNRPEYIAAVLEKRAHSKTTI